MSCYHFVEITFLIRGLFLKSKFRFLIKHESSPIIFKTFFLFNSVYVSLFFYLYSIYFLSICHNILQDFVCQSHRRLVHVNIQSLIVFFIQSSVLELLHRRNTPIDRSTPNLDCTVCIQTVPQICAKNVIRFWLWMAYGRKKVWNFIYDHDSRPQKATLLIRTS